MRHLIAFFRNHFVFMILSHRDSFVPKQIHHFVFVDTSAGKTTLIKALTGDAGLHPQDRLFATLDVTMHAGQLPSRVTVLYVDTIGFLSQLPHQLIDSFAATLEDIKHSVTYAPPRRHHTQETSGREFCTFLLNMLRIWR